MDALSDVLRAVRLTGAIFFDVHASEPWVAETPGGASIVGRMFPGAEHLVSYHVMTHGSCWATVHGGTPIRLSAGDIVVFPQGDGHAMSSTPGMRKAPDVAMYRPPTEGQLPFTISVGDSTEESARFVCGFLGCDVRPFNPLLATLPPLLHLRRDFRTADDPLGQLVDFTLAESREARPGGDCVRLRLSELMFVEVVRRYLAALPAEERGWLAGLRDPLVGRALALLHERPAHPWTLEALARDVGASRSVLADRFAHFVGHPPIQYLTRWRMQVAARLLAEGVRKVSAVALEVGYDSEAAFSRAFKKMIGVPPSAWRLGIRTGSEGDEVL